MSGIKIGPLVRSIALALVFFVLGRLVVDQMGSAGIWLVFGLLALFYGVWWLMRRSGKER